MSEQATVTGTPEVVALYAEYARAKEARARWEVEEKRLKGEIDAVLYDDPDDPKPSPVKVVDDNGEDVFEVKIGSYRGLDFTYLKNTYPHIYAECETRKATKQIKPPAFKA